LDLEPLAIFVFTNFAVRNVLAATRVPTGIAAMHLRGKIIEVRLFGLLLLVAGSLHAQADRASQ
jgi:hypothetical protein